MHDQLVFKDGVMFYRWEDCLECRLLLNVPDSLQGEVLHMNQDSRDSGYLGQRNTYMCIMKSFYWFRMNSSVYHYVKTCANCNMNKKPRHQRRAELGQYHVGAPMDRVMIDILGPLSKTPHGNMVILMLCDNPAGLLASQPACLTLWPHRLERWLTTLSGLSTQVQIPIWLLLLGLHIGSSSAGLGKAQSIDSSLRADWLSCLWPGENGGLPDRGGWCHWGREECDNQAGLLASQPVGLTLWPSQLGRWLATLSGLSTQVQIPCGCRCRDVTVDRPIHLIDWVFSIAWSVGWINC